MLATALGPSIAAMLDASDTIEVIANPDGRLWLEQVGKGRIPTTHRLDGVEIERVIRLVATLTGAEVTRDKPIISAELPPRGERFEGVLPPFPVDPASPSANQRGGSSRSMTMPPPACSRQTRQPR